MCHVRRREAADSQACGCIFILLGFRPAPKRIALPNRVACAIIARHALHIHIGEDAHWQIWAVVQCHRHGAALGIILGTRDAGSGLAKALGTGIEAASQKARFRHQGRAPQAIIAILVEIVRSGCAASKGNTIPWPIKSTAKGYGWRTVASSCPLLV